MRSERWLRGTILSATCSAALVWSVPGFAQSHTVRLRDAPAAATRDASFTTAGVARIYDPRSPIAPPIVDVPPNLTFSRIYGALIASMLRTSPTFRRQCLRIASAPDLSVAIRSGQVPVVQGLARARTHVLTRPTGQREAIVEVVAMQDHAELIAHEIEHIIEQLDGVDLAARATLTATGVRRCANGAFETTRAIRAGLAVAEEMRRSGR